MARVIYNYLDYNPSYSHPGMPMSTPTSFQNFVVPRPPQGINWPQPQFTPMTQGGRGQRPTTFQPPRSTGTPGQPSFDPTSFGMMGMTDPSGWQDNLPGMDQPAPYPQNQNWSQGPPRQIRIPPRQDNIPSYYNPPDQQRRQYISPYQQTMQGAYDFIPERLRRFLGLDI